MSPQQKNFSASSGGQNERQNRRKGIDDMLLGFVTPEGDLRVAEAQGLLDVIGNNLLHVKNLSANNISAIYWQRQGLQWPIFSSAARGAGLDLRPEMKGKGAWILVPRDKAGKEEMESAKRDRPGAIGRAVDNSVDLLNRIGGEMREEASYAADEKSRVAEEIRVVITAKGAGFQAQVVQLRTRLSDLDTASKEGFAAADHIQGEATRLGEMVNNVGVEAEAVAVAATEIGSALTQYAMESETVDQAHTALGQATRLVRGHSPACKGKPVDWEPVRCVFDLERDYVRNDAWRTAINSRRNPVVDAGENALDLADCLRQRGATDLPANPLATNVTTLTYKLVKRLAEESEASNAATVFATYFTARALGAPAVKMPNVRIPGGKDAQGNPKEEVTQWELTAAIKDGITLARRTLSEVIAYRQTHESHGEILSAEAQDQAPEGLGADTPVQVAEQPQEEAAALVVTSRRRGR